jgi:uncharacterized membrane protein
VPQKNTQIYTNYKTKKQVILFLFGAQISVFSIVFLLLLVALRSKKIARASTMATSGQAKIYHINSKPKSLKFSQK